MMSQNRGVYTGDASTSSQQQRITLPGGGGPVPAAVRADGGMPSEVSKRKVIQQQLVLLLHAHKCQRKETSNSNDRDGQQRQQLPCNLPHCDTMKNVLTHITSCSAHAQCQFPHCASSRQIITHWKNCQRNDCPVCEPLKPASGRPAVGVGSDLDSLNIGPVLHQQQQLPLQPSNNNANQLLPNPMPINGPLPPPAGENDPMSQQQQQMSAMNGPYNGPGGAPFPHGPLSHQLINNMPPVLVGSSNSFNIIPNSGGGGIIKEWQRGISEDLRGHLVQKITQVIVPHASDVVFRDKRYELFIENAKKVESDMFSKASSKEDYYGCLAEKIYKIRKELDEKRHQRERQQKPQLQQVNRLYNGPGSASLPHGPLEHQLVNINILPPVVVGSSNSTDSSAIAPNSGSGNKDWQRDISKDLRRRLVQKILHVIVPHAVGEVYCDERYDLSVQDAKRLESNVFSRALRKDPSDVVLYCDERYDLFVEYAERVESDMFSTALSEEDYHGRLAEKFYELQKCVQRERQRMQQQLQQQQMEGDDQKNAGSVTLFTDADY